MSELMVRKYLIWIHMTLFLQLFGMIVAVQSTQICRTNCECCTSAQDGSRNLTTICGGKSDTKCKTGCKDGFYGTKCYNKCPNYCITCSRQFGMKAHPDDYQICYKCADGFYNSTGITNCSTPCPKNCANNQCDKSIGHCLSGCKNTSWTGDKCNQCATGFYGVNCEFCPENCNNDVCDKLAGICTDGCKGNYVGSKCEKCIDFLYGEDCKKVCPHCLNGQCDRITGICDDCWNGYYSQYCNMTCSSGCKNMLCYRYNATCTLGCKEGYSEDTCCVDANGCQICDTSSTCSSYNPVPGVNMAIGIAAAALALVVLSFIISILNAILARRWRIQFMRQFRGPSNSISYVNTLFHLTSEGTVDTAGSPDDEDTIVPQAQYENLEAKRNTHIHAYEEIQLKSSDQ